MNQKTITLKITAIILFAVSILFSQVCFAKYSGGSGTSGDPYQIATAGDFKALGADTNDYAKYFILTADIDLSTNSFTTAVIAIGADDESFEGVPFAGDFNGNSHKISNLTINTNGAKNDYLGLFGKIGPTGKIKNLRLENIAITIDSYSSYIGGLAGCNCGDINNCHSTGSITSEEESENIGGLVGWNSGGTINNCHSAVTVTSDYSWEIGGLVAWNEEGNINNCYATGLISGEDVTSVGGLVADNDYGTITNCYSTGSVTGGDEASDLGGLVGYNDEGTIDNCYSTGAVTGGDEASLLGGLVGYNESGDVNNCYSTGAVSGSYEDVGGLVGYNYDATISNCYSTGAVTGGDGLFGVGGLVGYNESGDINNCYSTGVVTGGDEASDVGGLVGYNYDATISNCYSTGSVSGSSNSEYVGGLVGGNDGYGYGSISNCYSTGLVAGNYDVGGLVGYNVWGSISNCYSTGSVSGSSGSYYVGGLAGYNDYDISNCYSTGSVSGSSEYVGGLVGGNYGYDYGYGYGYGSISNCYSTGPVSGSSSVGGLVGFNYDATISNCYSTGSVSGYYNVGGLVGYDYGDISSCYFLVTSGPDNGYGTPLTDTQMKQQTNFAGWDFLGETDNGTDDIWIINEDVNYPELAWAYVHMSPPAGVSASDGSYTDHVRVTWDSVYGATAYEVWRSIDSNSSSASKLGDYTSPFDDSSVTPGTTYYYWIKARSRDTSGFSLSDSGYACPIPSAPTSVSASDGAYADHIRVAWGSVSGAIGYEVWRSSFDNSDLAYKLDDSNTSPFDDNSVTTEKTYYYWVKARNNCVTGDFGSSDHGYVSAIPKAVSITKCTVTAGSKDKDKISFSGEMNPAYDDLYLTNVIQIAISSDDMAEPYVITIPIDNVNANYKKTGKFSYSGTDEKGVKKSFMLDFKTNKFSLAAQNVNLSGLSCPLKVGVVITRFEVNTIVDETIVNGPKKPIPINLLTGVKNSLRVDKSKFTRKSSSITQLAISGGFSVEDADVNMANRVNRNLVVTLGTQTFTIPASKLKAGKGKFTCSNVALSGGETAAATFDFNKYIFALTIKNTNFAATAGTTDFGIALAGFSGSDKVKLP